MLLYYYLLLIPHVCYQVLTGAGNLSCKCDTWCYLAENMHWVLLYRKKLQSMTLIFITLIILHTLINYTTWIVDVVRTLQWCPSMLIFGIQIFTLLNKWIFECHNLFLMMEVHVLHVSSTRIFLYITVKLEVAVQWYLSSTLFFYHSSVIWRYQQILKSQLQLC